MIKQVESQEKNERIYSLDALRGLMMLIGIVIHSALTYGVIEYGAAWDSKQRSANNH